MNIDADVANRIVAGMVAANHRQQTNIIDMGPRRYRVLLDGTGTREEIDADVACIAAAPKMLEALRGAHDFEANPIPEASPDGELTRYWISTGALRDIRAAIAAATGGEP